MPLIEADADDDFERRWTAWLERGAAHDRRLRRRLVFAGPGFIIGAAVLVAVAIW